MASGVDPESLEGPRRHLPYLRRVVRTRFCVALEAQHDLWGSVPSSSDVLSHVSGILLRVHGETSCQTKVTNFELAVGIDEQVTGLEITM